MSVGILSPQTGPVFAYGRYQVGDAVISIFIIPFLTKDTTISLWIFYKPEAGFYVLILTGGCARKIMYHSGYLYGRRIQEATRQIYVVRRFAVNRIRSGKRRQRPAAFPRCPGNRHPCAADPLRKMKDNHVLI